MKELTQTYLKEALYYNPEAGIFTWKKNRGKKTKKGGTAGSLKEGYYRISIDNVSYRSHRLAFLYMTGEFPENQVDHINHDRGDNKWCNLREVTTTENKRNCPMSKGNTSGFTGVHFHKGGNGWVSSIKINGKIKYLGFFKDIKDAIKVRKKANIKYGFHPNHGKATI